MRVTPEGQGLDQQLLGSTSWGTCENERDKERQQWERMASRGHDSIRNRPTHKGIDRLRDGRYTTFAGSSIRKARSPGQLPVSSPERAVLNQIDSIG